MKTQIQLSHKGVTLIELLVALVIGGMIIGGIYRVFINQGKAYTVQDQVVEVQQNIRSAMEIMVRDIRMAGFDYDNPTSLIEIPNLTSLIQASNNSITIEYEYYRAGPPLVSERHTITYSINGTDLRREITINGAATTTEDILENVDALEFFCGTDGIIGDYSTQDGVVDGDLVPCGNIDINEDKVISVRINLTARPEQENPQDDRFQMVSPRTLTSTVALRNIAFLKM